MKRLVRGLGSNRASARQGFFVALVQVLKDNPSSVSWKSVNEVINDTLTQKGSKSEEGEFMTGQILAHGALLRSGTLTPEEACKSITSLFDVSAKRSYLLSASRKFIIDFIESVPTNDFAKHYWPIIKEKCKFNSSLESVWTLLVAHEKFPVILDTNFIQETFDRKNLFTKEFSSEIASILSVS